MHKLLPSSQNHLLEALALTAVRIQQLARRTETIKMDLENLIAEAEQEFKQCQNNASPPT